VQALVVASYVDATVLASSYDAPVLSPSAQLVHSQEHLSIVAESSCRDSRARGLD
jgi:hypothetical protein